MSVEEAFFLEALMLRKAEDGLRLRILERFSSLLFLSFECAALTDFLRLALARHRFTLPLATVSWLGGEEAMESKVFLDLMTFLVFLQTSGQTKSLLTLLRRVQQTYWWKKQQKRDRSKLRRGESRWKSWKRG